MRKVSDSVDTPRIALLALQRANELICSGDVIATVRCPAATAAAQVSSAASQLVIAELLELLLTEVRELRTTLSSRRVGL